MKRLILTSSSGFSLTRSGLAEAVIQFAFRFVWGPYLHHSKLEAYFGVRADQGPGDHWSDWSPWGRWSPAVRARKNLSFIEYCEIFAVIELWFDPDPNDQLELIFLLDFFHAHPETAAKLRLRFIAFDLLIMRPDEIPEPEDVPAVDVTTAELETGRVSWQAYRASTPQPCFDLLSKNLSALPLLRPALLALMEEIPGYRTGLGATEMRLLELVAGRHTHPLELTHPGRLGTGIFSEIEMPLLIEGLAHGPEPALAGLERARGMAKENHAGRHAAYMRSRLSLTELGENVLAHKEDFSRYNPIDRWWGGTHLTNNNLWRWHPALMKP
ncbi:hypothetical protein ACFFWD_07395 [Bradyrhizobium erythrophlei]|uniref:hypothetical protein n=1 Tax=Bradyrhizobium erythrophlei TaxID=1437360 RepID=UPI0035F05473